MFSDRRVFDGRAFVGLVTHDADDGAWQFLPPEGASVAEAMLVALVEIVALDPKVAELADLPTGFSAERSSPKTPWRRRETGA